MRTDPESRFGNRGESIGDTQETQQPNVVMGGGGKAHQVELVPFNFNTASVRIVFLNGEAWFVGADVCKVLGIAKARNSLARLEIDEQITLNPGAADNARMMTLISESGVYALILRSRKPAARKFRQWVTSKVLPSIRRTGAYSQQPAADPATEHNDIADIINRRTGIYIVIVDGAQRTMQETETTEVMNIVNNALSTMMAGALIEAQGALTFSIPEGLLLGTENGFASGSLRQAVSRGADVASRYLKVSRFRADESDAMPGGMPL